MAGTLINKDAKINSFITKVIDPAINAIQYHRGNVDTGGFDTSLETIAAMNVKPNSFNQVPTLGGLMTASDLAALFQYYAYRLTSIRDAQVRRWNTPSDTYTLVSDGITALSRTWCMSVSTFNNYVTQSPNPLANLQPSNVNSEAALDALIDRLAQICANHRTSQANLTICHSSCHSSCHGSCHGSRGRR